MCLLYVFSDLFYITIVKNRLVIIYSKVSLRQRFSHKHDIFTIKISWANVCRIIPEFRILNKLN